MRRLCVCVIVAASEKKPADVNVCVIGLECIVINLVYIMALLEVFW